MISLCCKAYCCEPLDIVENYDKAISSDKLYILHHRMETDKNFTSNELKTLGLYFNRPASELIFLERREHEQLHKAGSKIMYKEGELYPRRITKNNIEKFLKAGWKIISKC